MKYRNINHIMKSQANNIETPNKNCSDLHSALNGVIFELLDDETSLLFLQNKLMNIINIRYGDAIEKYLRRNFEYRHLFRDHIVAENLSTSVKQVDETVQNYTTRSAKCITRNILTVPLNTSCDIDKQYEKSPISLLNVNDTNNKLDHHKRVHGQVEKQKVIVEYSNNSFLASHTDMESVAINQDKNIPTKKKQAGKNYLSRPPKNSNKKENIDRSTLISKKNKRKSYKQNINNNLSQVKMLEYKPMEQIYEFKIAEDGVMPISKSSIENNEGIIESTKVENSKSLKKLEKPSKDTCISFFERSSLIEGTNTNKDDKNKSQTIWFQRSKDCAINRPKYNITSLKNIHEYFSVSNSDKSDHIKDNHNAASEKNGKNEQKSYKGNCVENNTMNKHKLKNNSEKKLDGFGNDNIPSIGIISTCDPQIINSSNNQKSINISSVKNIQAEENFYNSLLEKSDNDNGKETGLKNKVNSQIECEKILNTIESDNSEFYQHQNICPVENLESNISTLKKIDDFFSIVNSDNDKYLDNMPNTLIENKLEVMNDNILGKQFGDEEIYIDTIDEIINSNSSNTSVKEILDTHNEIIKDQEVAINKDMENVQMIQNEKKYNRDSTKIRDNNNDKSIVLKEEIKSKIKNVLFSNSTASKLKSKSFSKDQQEESVEKVQTKKKGIKLTISPVDIFDGTNRHEKKQKATLNSLNMVKDENGYENEPKSTLNSLSMIEGENRDVKNNIINYKSEDFSIRDYEKTEYTNTTNSSLEGKAKEKFLEESEIITENNKHHNYNEMLECRKHTNEIEYMIIKSDQIKSDSDIRDIDIRQERIKITNEARSQIEIQKDVEFKMEKTNIQKKITNKKNNGSEGSSHPKIQKKVNCSQLFQVNDRSSTISNNNEIIDLTNILNDENVTKVSSEMTLIRKESSNVSDVPETLYSTGMREMSKNTPNILLKIVYKKDNNPTCIENTESEKDKKCEINIDNVLTKRENGLDEGKKVRKRVLEENKNSSFRRRYNLRSVSPEPKKKKIRRLFGHTDIVTRSRASL